MTAVHHHDIDGRAAVRCLRRYGAQHVGQVVCRRIGCAEDALSRKRGRQRIAGAWRMVRRKRVRIDLPQQLQTVTSGVHLISSLWTAARFAEVDGAGDLAVHDGHRNGALVATANVAVPRVVVGSTAFASIKVDGYLLTVEKFDAHSARIAA